MGVTHTICCANLSDYMERGRSAFLLPNMIRSVHSVSKSKYYLWIKFKNDRKKKRRKGIKSTKNYPITDALYFRMQKSGSKNNPTRTCSKLVQFHNSKNYIFLKLKVCKCVKVRNIFRDKLIV